MPPPPPPPERKKRSRPGKDEGPVAGNLLALAGSLLLLAALAAGVIFVLVLNGGEQPAPPAPPVGPALPAVPKIEVDPAFAQSGAEFGEWQPIDDYDVAGVLKAGREAINWRGVVVEIVDQRGVKVGGDISIQSVAPGERTRVKLKVYHPVRLTDVGRILIRPR